MEIEKVGEEFAGKLYRRVSWNPFLKDPCAK